MARLNNLTQEVALATGDAFVCASERQRDFWLGALASVGRLDSRPVPARPVAAHAHRRRPVRHRPGAARARAGAARSRAGHRRTTTDPALARRDLELVRPAHGDPRGHGALATARRRAPLLPRRRSTRIPGVPDMAMATEAVALADELGLRDRVVFFNFGWVPYAERGRYLLEADLAVSAHFDDVETRFVVPNAASRLPLGGPAGRDDPRGHARRRDRRAEAPAAPSTSATCRLGRRARDHARRRTRRCERGSRRSRPAAPVASSGRSSSRRSAASPIRERRSPAAPQARSRRRRRVSGAPSPHRLRAARARAARHAGCSERVRRRRVRRRRNGAWVP